MAKAWAVGVTGLAIGAFLVGCMEAQSYPPPLAASADYPVDKMPLDFADCRHPQKAIDYETCGMKAPGATKASVEPAEAPRPSATPISDPQPVPHEVQVAQATIPPNDAYADNYSKGQFEQYTQELGAIFESIKNIYFAAGCRVLGEAQVGMLVNSERIAFVQVWIDRGIASNPYAYTRDASGRLVDRVDKEIDDGITAAARDGLALASSQGKCAYWKENPQAVYALRQLAGSAFMP